jgi:DNA-binding transcriptional regulator YiaG
MTRENENTPAEINKLIKKTGGSVAQVAEFLGVHKRTVYRWMSGESPTPVSVIKALSLLIKSR